MNSIHSMISSSGITRRIIRQQQQAITTASSITTSFCWPMQILQQSHNNYLFRQTQQQTQTHTRQTRYMSKYLSKAGKKRLNLTTKRATKQGFYKGKGSTKEGKLNSKGKFIIDPLKQLELVVPQDLSGFKVITFVIVVCVRVMINYSIY